MMVRIFTIKPVYCDLWLCSKQIFILQPDRNIFYAVFYLNLFNFLIK